MISLIGFISMAFLPVHRPVAAIHLAALAHVGESIEAPELYRNNVVGSISLFEALKSAGINDLVLSSTCAVYGTPSQLPITEQCPTNPINPYGRSKLMIEQILADYQVTQVVRSTSLRYLNAAGADPEGSIGTEHDPETHLIPNALRAAAGQISDLQVFGRDYPAIDGTCVRDFVHVHDWAAVHVAALRRMQGAHLV